MAVIKMNYAAAQEMAQSFSRAKQTVEGVSGEINTVAQILTDGALIGDAGDAFGEACRTDLIPTLQRLAEKLEELNQDMIYSIDAMRSVDSEMRQLYG